MSTDHNVAAPEATDPHVSDPGNTDPGTRTGAPARLPWLVPGTVAVAYLLATGRWGSYLGLPKQRIYATDILVAATLVWTLVRHRHLLRRAVRSSDARFGVLAPVLALAGWAVLRYAFSGHTALVAVRDVAPYAYLLVACAALLPVDAAAVTRSKRVLLTGLVLHASWVTVSVLAPHAVSRLPFIGNGHVRLLELRHDFDGAMLAVLAGVALHGLLHARRVRDALGWFVLVVWPVVAVLLLANRGAVLALVVALAATSVTLLRALTGLARRRPALVAGGLLIVVAALAVGIPQTPIYQRLTGSAVYSRNTAQGTTQAREQAWSEVLDYVDDSPTRVLFGVGMGPDFLLASGASVHYQAVGYEVVRQPHNYMINTYARLGAVGVLLLAWLMTALTRSTCRVLLAGDRLDIALPAVLLWSTLFVTALIGVILESPFGAVPFGWAAGLILVGGARERSAGRAPSKAHHTA